MGRRPQPTAIQEQKAAVRSVRQAPGETGAAVVVGRVAPPAWLAG